MKTLGFETINNATFCSSIWQEDSSFMKVNYPIKNTVSVWIGNFKSEEDFDACVDQSVAQALSLETDIASICEVGFQREQIGLQDLIAGFSGSDTFVGLAVAAATVRGITTANSALVCYFVNCVDAPNNWGELVFLGSFSTQNLA